MVKQKRKEKAVSSNCYNTWEMSVRTLRDGRTDMPLLAWMQTVSSSEMFIATLCNVFGTVTDVLHLCRENGRSLCLK